MQSIIEFSSYVKNETIAIPEDFISAVPNEVYVIVKPKEHSTLRKYPHAG